MGNVRTCPSGTGYSLPGSHATVVGKDARPMHIRLSRGFCDSHAVRKNVAQSAL